MAQFVDLKKKNRSGGKDEGQAEAGRKGDGRRPRGRHRHERAGRLL